jgi:hypothetical protein
MPFDVFISFKNLDPDGLLTRDSELAREVYQYLTRQGLRPFMSSISLEQLGVAAYQRAIDDALDDVGVVVVVGTSRANLDSEWVRYEWESFHRDILNSSKRHGRIFTYVEGLAPPDLPRPLRGYQMIVQGPDSLSRLCNFITASGANAGTPKASSKPEEESPGLVRHMLVAEEPSPCFILASPKTPSGTLIELRPVERTFGENLGILGLSTALGNCLGEGAGLELIPAGNAPPGIVHRPLNLYLIGTPLANPLVRDMLRTLQGGRAPDFEIKPYGRGADRSHRLELSRISGDSREWIVGETRRQKLDGALVGIADYGVIVRGPHPEYPRHMILVLAGAHSLGTGAACLAATRSRLIESLKRKLPSGVLLDRGKTIWALVRGQVSEEDGALNAEGVAVVEAGVYE